MKIKKNQVQETRLSKKKNKKAVSGVIITTLLVLLALIVGGMIYLSSSSFLDRMEKESAVRLAKEQCSTRFDVKLSACYVDNSLPDTDEIHLDIINLKEDIPLGSQILLGNEQGQIFMPITALNSKETQIKEGEGRSIVIILDTIELTNFNLERIRFVPIFITKDQRVLCEDIPEVDIGPCQG